jgi:hypothetical protein
MIARQSLYPTLFKLNEARVVFKAAAVLSAFLFCLAIAHGQAPPEPDAGDPRARVIDGVISTTVFGLGESIRITGTVKEGAVAFGGDVIVEGSVDGDVAAIGGSVIQRAGSRIGGDVIVVGGAYNHGSGARAPQSVTIMYAGYEDDLKRAMQEPFSLLHPQLTAAFFGLRLLAILFWFVVSLALTAAMPSTVSRAVARLQLTSLRVAIIGLVGSVVIVAGVPLSLWLLPPLVSAVVVIAAILLIIVGTLFGRVVIFAATGHWLQRRFPVLRAQPESVKLLLGVTLWIVLSSLPYLWPVVVAALIVTSLGLALTARYRLTWAKPKTA